MTARTLPSDHAGGRRALVAEIGLVGIAAVWGLTFVLVQDAVALLPPLTFLAYRFLAAALLVAALSWRKLLALPRRGWWGGAVLGAWLSLGFALQTLGLVRTTVSNAGFITGLFVVLTPVLGAVLFRERITPLAWAAAAVSAAGLYLLSGGAQGLSTGDLLVLGCAVAFSFHILFTGRLVARFDAVALVAVQLGTCGLLCALAALAAEGFAVPRGRTVWVALVVTSVVASALGFFVQSYAQQHAPPDRTALILASEPAFTGLFGFWLKGERLTATAWLGAGLILVAMLAVELLRSRRARLVTAG